MRNEKGKILFLNKNIIDLINQTKHHLVIFNTLTPLRYLSEEGFLNSSFLISHSSFLCAMREDNSATKSGMSINPKKPKSEIDV